MKKEGAPIGPAKLVGARVRRREDPRLITGNGNYVGGMVLPGMQELAFLRSPHAHARLRRIDCERARAAPGVLAVFSGADLEDRARPLRAELIREQEPGYKACDWFPLARDKVRHVGEAVAAVVASDRYRGEDALADIEVDYEILEAVTDSAQALNDDAPRIHEEWGDNIRCHSEFSAGEPDSSFERAHKIVRQRFRAQRHHPLPLEPRGCVAAWDAATEDLTLWSSSQMPHMLRTKLAEVLELPEHRIRVIAPDVGGGFGLKCHLFPEEVVASVAAMQLRRPVRWLEDRQESFAASFHAKEQTVDGELALAADGALLGARLRLVADSGAYSSYPWTSAAEVLHTSYMFPGPYRLPSYSFSATSVATNKTTNGSYRGVGGPMATFVMEGLLDLAARELGMDPIDIRRRNLLRKDEFPYESVTGMPYEVGSYLESLERAAEVVDYAAFRRGQAELREKGIHRGIGLSCYNEMTAHNSKTMNRLATAVSAYESANIKLDPSGRVTVFSGTHSHGQAHETIYAQIAADALGLPIEAIVVRLGDTRETPYGWGTWASRAAVAGGTAVGLAAEKLAAKLRRIAGHWLEVSPEDIELAGGSASVKGVPGRALRIAEIAKRALFSAVAELPEGEEPGLETTEYYEPPPVTFPNATHIAVVEVDVETGAVEILRYVAIEDCGKMINPMVVDGQIAGGVVQGLGGALLEHLVYDDSGQLLTMSLMDYLLPSASSVPAIEISHLETPSPLVPGGFKGVGEGGAIAAWAALANAVTDALQPSGDGAYELPLSPERVRALALGSNATF